MPRYTYKCDSCETTLEAAHPYNEKIQNCPECGSDLFNIVPSMVMFSKPSNTKKGVGAEVRQTINETKEEIKKDRRRTREDYKP